MTDVLDDMARRFNEVYEVVRVVDIVRDDIRYRFEVLKGYTNPHVPYTVRAYVEESVVLQPEYPQTGKQFDRDPEGMRVWRVFGISWIAQNDPDSALRQALGFFADHQDDDIRIKYPR